jgi:hypothetical protein
MWRQLEPERAVMRRQLEPERAAMRRQLEPEREDEMAPLAQDWAAHAKGKRFDNLQSASLRDQVSQDRELVAQLQGLMGAS